MQPAADPWDGKRHRMGLSGRVGSIRWAWYVAAGIEGYAVSWTRDAGWVLSAQVVVSDAFKLAQRPLLFVAPHPKGEWIWPIERWRLEDGGRLVARLGPRERGRRC